MTNEVTSEAPKTASGADLPPKSPKTNRKVSIAANVPDNVTPPPKADLSQLFRRKSTFRGLAQSITNAIAMRRFTKTSIDVPQKPKVKMENTYKMNPDDGKIFYSEKVHREVTDILEAYLSDVTYNPKTAGSLTENLTDMIKNRIKALKFDRYKIVCNVILGQCSDQGLEAASRSLWDDKTDNFTSVTYKNKSMVAIVTVFGIYYE